jgi:hypothetical protein
MLHIYCTQFREFVVRKFQRCELFLLAGALAVGMVSRGLADDARRDITCSALLNSALSLVKHLGPLGWLLRYSAVRLGGRFWFGCGDVG